MNDDRRDCLVALRRDLHRHPEPAWREFATTCRIVTELERIGVDDLFVGPEVLADGERMAVPDDVELNEWYERARERGVREDILNQLEGGYTGAMAVLDRGAGPTVALRVDIDGLPITESESSGHTPAAEGFRSENEGYMHACGHDAHATIGIGVLEAIKESDFSGTLKVVFQPAEEVVGGGKPVAESGRLDDVDYLLAMHIGLDHPTREVVAGVEGILAVSHFTADFTGESAHAGGHPAAGRNAVQAMATAVQNLYSIPRQEDGATRINAGVVEGGTAANIIPGHASIEGEVRGETTALMEYMRERADAVLKHAAGMHDCEVSVSRGSVAPSADSDAEMIDRVYDVAGQIEEISTRLRRADLGVSEDATYLMQRVKKQGGLATFVCVGTDHPGSHHTPTFDVDEHSLAIGVDLLSKTIKSLAREQPR